MNTSLKLGITAFLLSILASLGIAQSVSMNQTLNTTLSLNNTAYLNSTIVVNNTGGLSNHITHSIDNSNGQTFGWVASNDPTGWGVRSSVDYLCTMYVNLGGVMVYWQTNSFYC